MQRRGVPVVICLCSTQTQRQSFIASVRAVQDASGKFVRDKARLELAQDQSLHDRLEAEALLMRPLQVVRLLWRLNTYADVC